MGGLWAAAAVSMGRAVALPPLCALALALAVGGEAGTPPVGEEGDNPFKQDGDQTAECYA